MSLRSALERRSVEGLTRAACVFVLAALALICWSILSPGVVPVMLAMSLGHVLGTLGFGCYLVAVVVDIARSSRKAGGSRDDARRVDEPSSSTGPRSGDHEPNT